MIGKDTLDYCYKVRDELVKMVNGRITFREVNSVDDTKYIVFRVEFKDFVYDHVVTVPALTYEKTPEAIANKLISDYKWTLFHSFFKNN